MKRHSKKVDVGNMAPEEAMEIGEMIGKKIGKLGDAAADKINKITEIYGLKAKVYVQLFSTENDKTPEEIDQ